MRSVITDLGVVHDLSVLSLTHFSHVLMQMYKQNTTHQTLTPQNNTKMRFFNN